MPLERLDKRCALTGFTGLPQDTRLRSLKTNVRDTTTVKCVDEVRARNLLRIEATHLVLHEMHRDFATRSSENRCKELHIHKARTKIGATNFSKSDFVLRGIFRKEKRVKLEVKWRRPYRVVACQSEYIFTVKYLFTAETHDVHGRRLRFFRKKDFGVTEEVRNHLAYQQNELLLVRTFEEISRVAGYVELLTNWRGF